MFNNFSPQAAKTTNAWLITTGSNVGVMKAVGNAVSEGQSFLWDDDRITHTLRLIGIGPWGYVKNRKKLISRGDVSTLKNQITITVSIECFILYVRSYNTPGSEDKLNYIFSNDNLYEIYLHFLFQDILYALIECYRKEK